jgi:hypothetical protein
MRHLGRFVDHARTRGGRFRQDFPSDCTPIVPGWIVSLIARLRHTGSVGEIP